MKEQFYFGLDILKAEERDGRPFLTIYATDTIEDRQKESCTRACLDKMVGILQSGQVELVGSHHAGIGFGRAVDGRVVPAETVDGPAGELALLSDIELDPEFPEARKLFEEAKVGKCKRQFSIGGRLNKDNPQKV